MSKEQFVKDEIFKGLEHLNKDIDKGLFAEIEENFELLPDSLFWFAIKGASKVSEGDEDLIEEFKSKAFCTETYFPKLEFVSYEGNANSRNYGDGEIVDTELAIFKHEGEEFAVEVMTTSFIDLDTNSVESVYGTALRNVTPVVDLEAQLEKELKRLKEKQRPAVLLANLRNSC